MRLRGRFTLWFSLAALVPIAVAALVTREVVSRSYTEQFEDKREAAGVSLRRELDDIESSVSRTVKDMVRSEARHPLVHGVVLQLEINKGALDPRARKRMKEDGARFRSGLGLDVLAVVDTEDEVLVAPHNPPAHNTVDPTPRERASARRGEPYYVLEATWQGDRIVSILAVESAREYRQGEYGVVVVGGREITGELLDPIRRLGGIDARVVDPEGRVLVPAAQPDSAMWRSGARATFTETLAGPDGEATAAVEVVVSKAELERVLATVTLAAGILAGAALLITIGLGFFVARRMTANLDRLVEGAQAASRGDLDHRVAIKGKDEIGAVAQSFNVMMEDLRTSKERLVIAERVAAWQEIARRLAHEIKNPLTPIQMAVETLRKTWRKKHPSFDEIFEESTATVLEESARLKRIVGEFSEFARLPKPSLEPLDLSDAVSSCLALYKGSVPITRELADGLPSVVADRDQLAQMLLNLLENARHAVEESAADGGSIVVQTRLGEAGGRVELIVEDNGPGLPEHVKEKLFTPYFTTKEGGTGLGLAIVHRMMSDHGGRIVAGDSDLGGARFTVEFPVGSAEDHADPGSDASPPSAA